MNGDYSFWPFLHKHKKGTEKKTVCPPIFLLHHCTACICESLTRPRCEGPALLMRLLGVQLLAQPTTIQLVAADFPQNSTQIIGRNRRRICTVGKKRDRKEKSLLSYASNAKKSLISRGFWMQLTMNADGYECRLSWLSTVSAKRIT
jgi:hypothetical protein